MAVSNIKSLIPGELQKVWDLVLDIENYGAWRSDSVSYTHLDVYKKQVYESWMFTEPLSFQSKVFSVLMQVGVIQNRCV